MCSIFDDDLVVYEGHPEIPAVSHNSESFRVQPLTPANAGPGGAGKFGSHRLAFPIYDEAYNLELNNVYFRAIIGVIVSPFSRFRYNLVVVPIGR